MLFGILMHHSPRQKSRLSSSLFSSSLPIATSPRLGVRPTSVRASTSRIFLGTSG